MTSTSIFQKPIIIVCGSGGVGKTTLSATIGLCSALTGQRTLVVTIDPAQRLAQALGFKQLNQIQEIPQERLSQIGLQTKAPYYAMMLDSKRTFDDLILKYAPSPDKAQKILTNRIYQHLSQALTGSHEYMAMEKLYELHVSNQFDTIVLDTPPTPHALDFLEAPKRMTDFLDESLLKWILKPYFKAGEVSLRAFSMGSAFVFRTLEKLTGLELLADLSEFFLNFQGMYEGFKERAVHVNELLTSDKSLFLLVTVPDLLPLDEAQFFVNRLREYKMNFGGMIFNRLHPSPPMSLEQVKPWAQQQPFSPFLEKLLSNFENYRETTETEKQLMRHFLQQCPLDYVWQIPMLEEEASSLEKLRDISRFMLESGSVFPPYTV